MAVYESAQELIGRTPLVRLAYSGFPEDVKVYAKLELWNPSGSVKDRTGLYMVRDAEARGLLKPGGTIVEATAGNTGLGIAFAALNRGYRIIFVVPTKFSQEKQTLMRALGGNKKNTALMGDQVFTDVWTARAIGIRAILLPPIRDKKNALTRFKRYLERGVLRRYHRRHPDAPDVRLGSSIAKEFTS